MIGFSKRLSVTVMMLVSWIGYVNRLFDENRKTNNDTGFVTNKRWTITLK